MDNIKFYNGIWEGGTRQDVSNKPGMYYMQNIKWGYLPVCVIVPEYRAIRLHMEPDGSGKKTFWLHVGKYFDSNYVHNWDITRMRNGFGIEVKEVGFDEPAFVTIYGGTSDVCGGDYSDFNWFVRLHVKSDDADDDYYEGDDDFNNDAARSIKLPRFHNCKAYENKSGGGKIITLSQTGMHNLDVLNFGKKMSSIKITSEDLELVDIEYDWSAQTSDKETKYMAEESVSNATGLPTAPDVSLSDSIERSNEYSFNQEVGVSLTVGAEAEVGFLGTGGEVESEVESSVSVGFGQSKTSTRTYDISADASIEMPKWTSARAVLTFQMEKVTVPVKRIWKSKDTGEQTYDSGTQTYDNAANIHISYQDMAYIPNPDLSEDDWKAMIAQTSYQ